MMLRALSVLVMVMATCLPDSLAKPGKVPVPSPSDDCCDKGYFCCGTKCQPLSKKDDLFCILVEGGCCKKNCCEKHEVCCGDGCIPKEKAPVTLCPKDGKCGCGGGGKPYPKPDPNVPTCKQEPKVVGHCKARILSWSYNPKTGKCEKFYYGGCGGNDNRFKTKEHCYRKCGGIVKPPHGGHKCCKHGYFCCGKKCLKKGTKHGYCGPSKCCKKPPRQDKCCKHGYFCCGHKCIKKGSKHGYCGSPKCCRKKSCRFVKCPPKKYCCRGRCYYKWFAKKLGCL